MEIHRCALLEGSGSVLELLDGEWALQYEEEYFPEENMGGNWMLVPVFYCPMCGVQLTKAER